MSISLLQKKNGLFVQLALIRCSRKIEKQNKTYFIPNIKHFLQTENNSVNKVLFSLSDRTCSNI